jgi:GlpG protein
MGFEHTALSVGLDEDLLPLSALLSQRGLPHRIYEEGGRQVLKVAGAEQARQVRALHQAWREGRVSIELRRAERRATPVGLPRGSQPATLALIACSVAGFLLLLLNAPVAWIQLLTFQPFTVEEGRAVFQPMGGQYWRLVTPAFLHFSWLHIAFNCLWLWELGNRVERVMGPGNLIGLFLVIAVVSNTSQHLFGGPALFGGMSGVVYGLLGFSWVGARLQPAWSFSPSKPVMILMLVWLAVCIAGAVEGLGFGAVANAAHVGGLAAGAVLGAVFGLVSRYNSGLA